jgi:hypothetical protein
LPAALPLAVLAHRLCRREDVPLAVSDQVIDRLDRTLAETATKGGRPVVW